MPTGNPGVPRKLPFALPVEEWMKLAACKKTTLDFFPTNGHNLVNRPLVECCNSCPVQMACLDYALTNHIDHGIWGGTSERARRRILKARKNPALRLA